MTTSRVIRGSKGKIFLYVCAILVITALIACYNNTLSQLDDIKVLNELCHQQEENLSTQLQVISDVKQGLEKSLKTEKVEHQQTKLKLENKLNEEKSKHERLSSDMESKYNSLQQHYNLLQSNFDDLKDDCSKKQQNSLDEISELQEKLKQMKEEVKDLETNQETIKKLRSELEIENQNLQTELELKEKEANKYPELKQEFDSLKEKCSAYNDVLQEPKVPSPDTVNQDKVSPSENQVQAGNRASDTNVLHMPPIDKSSSSVKPEVKPSQAKLDGARPLLQPNVTPETKQKDVPKVENKLPEGVVAKPINKDYPNEQADVINDENKNNLEAKYDADKDNGAHEVFDAPLADGLGFGDNMMKSVQKQNVEKKDADVVGVEDKNKKQDDQSYRDHDVQLEPEEDDDPDDYNMARQEEPIVRH